MASSDDSQESADEEELERKQKLFLEKKKAVFEEMRESGDKLEKIRQEEMVVQKKLQKVKEYKREVERLNIENATLKELQATSSSALTSMKEKIAVCEREHGRAGDVNVTKEELETLRQQNVELSASLRTVKDAMQRITGYSKTQQKEKEQALRKVASLKDEIAALRQISRETQERQLSEHQSSKKQQQDQRTGKVHGFVIKTICKRTLLALCFLI